MDKVKTMENIANKYNSVNSAVGALKSFQQGKTWFDKAKAIASLYATIA